MPGVNYTWVTKSSPFTFHRLPGETKILLASDSGELEIWDCHPPGNTVERLESLASHDDMVMSISHLAGGEKIVSGSADKRYVKYSIMF